LLARCRLNIAIYRNFPYCWQANTKDLLFNVLFLRS
jgi:hypothetical protein